MADSLGVDGIVHLSVESGCGGTTFALQVAREHLTDGSHVVWVCSEMPNSDRFSQLYTDVDLVAVSRLHVIAVGENIVQGLTSANSMVTALDSITMIVIDDWAPKSGQVPSEILDKMRGLIECAEKQNVSLLMVSSAYEDASGNQQWKSRGNLDCDVWFLTRSDSMPSVRELHQDGTVLKLNLLDEGFIPRT
jgi:predicted ATP-dependent serine protease